MSRYPNLEVFAPDRYSYNTYNYTGLADGSKILGRNNRRVWFSVRLLGFVVIVDGKIRVDGNSDTAPAMSFDSTLYNNFNWSDYYTLVQGEQYIDFGGGVHDLQVVEVTVNETRIEETKHATSLLRLAEAKVENFSRWRSRGIRRQRHNNNNGFK